MPVTFAPLLNDGTQLIDGVHNATVSNALATQVLTALGESTAVPGQDSGRLLYAKVVAFQQSSAGLALNLQDQANVDRIRIAVGAAYRIQSGIIAWR